MAYGPADDRACRARPGRRDVARSAPCCAAGELRDHHSTAAARSCARSDALAPPVSRRARAARRPSLSAQRSSPPAQRSSPPARRSSPPAQRSSPPAPQFDRLASRAPRLTECQRSDLMESDSSRRKSDRSHTVRHGTHGLTRERVLSYQWFTRREGRLD